MRVSDRAIVLQSIRRGDNHFILKLFTCNNGLVTVSTRIARTASSKIRAAHIQPLSMIAVEITLKQNKEIQQLTEASACYDASGIFTSFPKLGIAQFINELLLKCLKESQPNSHLFEFTETCLKYLNDSEEGFVNLHLYYLSELTRYLGFEPQNNYNESNPYFDCRNGSFTTFNLAFPLGLNGDESRLFSEFLKINPLNVTISNSQRRSLLEILLTYYRFHVPGFNEVKSLEVLREVMA